MLIAKALCRGMNIKTHADCLFCDSILIFFATHAGAAFYLLSLMILAPAYAFDGLCCDGIAMIWLFDDVTNVEEAALVEGVVLRSWSLLLSLISWH